MKTAKKRNWLKTTIVVFLICGILGTALSAVLFFRNPSRTYASATLQFSFDGAADSLAPNNHHFSIDELGSDEVLSAALTEAGLSDVYTPDQLRGSLVVRGVYPDDIVSQVMSYESLLSFTANRELTISSYHPTVFSVQLTNEFDRNISRTQLETLLKSVMKSYQEFFKRHYSESLDIENSVYNLDSYDYPQQLEAISESMSQAVVYAQELYLREPAFSVGGMGFNDIAVRLTNLIDSEISRLNANITMNALTKDVARLLTQYQYQIRELNNQLSWQRERLSRLDNLIDGYEKNEIIYLSTADSLTKIDGNSSETYDSLVDNRKTVADEIVAINAQIANYQLLISDLTGEPVKQAEPANETVPVTEIAEQDGSEDDVPVPEPVVAETPPPAEELEQLTDEEIAAAAAAAEEASARQTAALERSINELLSKRNAILTDFLTLLKAYNEQEINEGTVTVTRYDYETPSLVSGAFILNTIKTAGPFCAVGLMVCLFLMIRNRSKEEKAKQGA